ncbi:MAG: serine hydrolase [Phenylobacterium zucineum]|nr:MAG: serine hydrolase [Phenylobacterium zucineum]
MRLAAVSFAFSLAALPAAAQPAGFDAIFAGYGAEAPGCAVGVKHRAEAPVLRGYGSADLEHGVAVTPDTVFEAGSVSKQFTAAAVLLLVQDGKLALGDDIRKHLPEMPDYGRPITVDMLLSHTSGLRDWGEVMALAGWPRTSRIYTHDEVLQIATRQKALNYAPGEAYSYTNTGYSLAGIIVQRLSGKSLADFTRERIFQPLGMTHTAWRDDFRRVVPGRAIAYDREGGAFVQDMPFENTYGHGALLTTVGDLLIWNDALTAGKLGGQVSARMAERATLTSGEKIAHSGSTAGYRAWLARYPDQQLSVALLCNRGDANPTVIGRRVADAFMKPAPPISADRATPPADLASLPGLYADERTGGVLRVAAEGQVLRIVSGPTLSAGAKPGTYSAGDAAFVFTADGATRTVERGESTTYRKVEPAAPDAAALAALAGTYESDEVGAVLRVTVRDGALALTPSDRPSHPLIATPLYADAFRADGGLVRVVRGADGRAVALKFTSSRVYALEFRRR